MKWIIQLATVVGLVMALNWYASHGNRSYLALAIFCAWLNLRSYIPDDEPVRSRGGWRIPPKEKA